MRERHVEIAGQRVDKSALSGLYPCGEGAGWAGGIVSAALDGIRVAEAIAAVVRQRSTPAHAR